MSHTDPHPWAVLHEKIKMEKNKNNYDGQQVTT